MNISVIIPAYNAAETIAETLESLLAQTYPYWEAIVINDGSHDKTSTIAASFSQEDPRIRVISQPQGGEAAARNTGIKSANFDWLLFLDADDLILPPYLERMTNALAAEPGLDAIHCGWARLTPNGKSGTEKYCPQSGKLFDLFARYCAFAIHACIIRRSLVEAVGNFDTSLHTCPDWDLWQRIARTGVRFGAVHEVLALYRMRPNSASIDGYQILSDGLRVITRGHSPDIRIPHPDPLYAQGISPEHLSGAKLYFACWAAGLVLGRGKDARPLLGMVIEDREPALVPDIVAQNLFEALLHSACKLPGDCDKLWYTLEQHIKEFLITLETQSMTPGLQYRTCTVLQGLIIKNSTAPRPITIGTIYATLLDITNPIPDITTPANIDRLHCTIEIEKTTLGTIELPVCDRLIPRYVLTDAIAAKFAWQIIGQFFEKTIYQELTVKQDTAGLSIWRGSLCLAAGLPEDKYLFWQGIHNKIGWTVFLQEIWGLPDWPQELFYRYKPQNRSFRPTISKYYKNSNWLVIEASENIPDVEIPDRKINAIFMVGGVAIGTMIIAVKNTRVRAQELRAVFTKITGFELCRIAVREGLLGKPINKPISLRERLATAARTSQCFRKNHIINISANINLAPDYVHAIDRALLPGEYGIVFGRHIQGTIGTSTSRRAVLPTAAANELFDTASVAGEPVFQILRPYENVSHMVYAPELIWRPFLNKQIGINGSNSNKTVQLKEHKIPCKNHTTAHTMTYQLPILMYHSISPTGSPALARYRVTPESFEEQLRYLHDAGFHSIRLEDWQTAMETKTPLSGRAVLITFDDGYRNFFTHAWPVLKHYGFSATVFIVTDEVGGSNRWDTMYGEQIPLLGWDEIHLLHAEGIEFGSHSASHSYLTALSAEEIVREGARSRAVLWRKLRVPVEAFAYPHGAEDEVVQHLIGACGYIYGLSCRWGFSSYHDSLLALPRLEVFGSDNLQNFIAKLNVHSTE